MTGMKGEREVRMENDKMEIEYRELQESESDLSLFSEFQRRQEVTECYRKVRGKWEIQTIPFIDDWTPEEYEVVGKCLRNTRRRGG